MTGSGNIGESWSTHQLTEFLALIASFSDERSAIERAIERAAETLDSEVAALIDGGEIIASVGFPEDANVAEVAEVVSGHRARLELSGVGELHAVAVPVGDEGARCLMVGRRAEPFAGDELDLLRGMGRVLDLGLRTLRQVDVERGLRSDSERQAEENSRLLLALRERQVLLERLGSVQRAIVAQRALHEVFDAIVEGACELTGDEVAILRLRDPDGGARTTVVASIGASQDAHVQAPYRQRRARPARDDRGQARRGGRGRGTRAHRAARRMGGGRPLGRDGRPGL
jgi:hypothetical protein